MRKLTILTAETNPGQHADLGASETMQRDDFKASGGVGYCGIAVRCWCCGHYQIWGYRPPRR